MQAFTKIEIKWVIDELEAEMNKGGRQNGTMYERAG